MANLGDSLTDPICPTYSAGTVSKTTGIGASAGGEFLNDYWNGKAGAGYGYQNQCNYGWTVGANNSDWTNGCHTFSVVPTYSSGLNSFGRTGRQS